MFENEWGIEDPEDLPVELLEKIKLAFQLLKEANVCEAIELDGAYDERTISPRNVTNT